MRFFSAMVALAALGCDAHLSSSGDSIDWDLDLVEGAHHGVTLDYELSDAQDDPAAGTISWRLFGAGTYYGGHIVVHAVEDEGAAPGAATEVGEIRLGPDLDGDDELFFGGGFDLPLAQGRQQLHLVLVHDGPDAALTGDVSLSVLGPVDAPARLTIHDIGYF